MLVAIREPDRGFDAIVVGEYERASPVTRSSRSWRCAGGTVCRCGCLRWGARSPTLRGLRPALVGAWWKFACCQDLAASWGRSRPAIRLPIVDHDVTVGRVGSAHGRV